MQKMIYIRPGSVTAAVEQYCKDHNNCKDNNKSFSAIVEDALAFYATQKGIVQSDPVQLLKQALALLEQD